MENFNARPGNKLAIAEEIEQGFTTLHVTEIIATDEVTSKVSNCNIDGTPEGMTATQCLLLVLVLLTLSKLCVCFYKQLRRYLKENGDVEKTVAKLEICKYS